jgi:hypothetical protein
MLAYLTEFLRGQPVLVFFLLLSLGYLVGNIRVAGISLGSAWNSSSEALWRLGCARAISPRCSRHISAS